MLFFKQRAKGLLLCICIALPAWLLGKLFPIAGGPVLAILGGMLLTVFLKNKAPFEAGIRFTGKKILQYAVVLLGFGLNLQVVLETGKQSLPIITATIAVSLLIAFALYKALHIPSKTAVLVGVGSSICGGSAIAATAPVIDANDEEIAQAISVIFLFNILAAVLFPFLGTVLGFSQTSGEGFGIFAGTAINDTSSVTAAAATWDNMFQLGSATLDKAVTVKLTRTLAIIPITLVLALHRTKTAKRSSEETVSITQVFPFFILYFISASLLTTAAASLGISPDVFHPLKELSKFFIIMSMAAIGLNTNLSKLIKTGAKPILMGFTCWLGITIVSLVLQRSLGLW